MNPRIAIVPILVLVIGCVESGIIKDIIYSGIPINGYIQAEDYGCTTVKDLPIGEVIICITAFRNSEGHVTSTKYYGVLSIKRDDYGQKELDLLEVTWQDEKNPSIDQLKESVEVKGERGDTLMLNLWKAQTCVYREYTLEVEKDSKGKVKRAYYRGTISQEKSQEYC